MQRVDKSYEELQSYTIEWLRFPLIVAVVFIHMIPVLNTRNIAGTFITLDSLYYLIACLGSYILPTIAVPTFFMISGFLFFKNIDNWNRGIYYNKLTNRFRSLVLPYILWNLIAIFVFLLMELLKSKTVFVSTLDLLSWDKIFTNFWNYHSWEGTRNLINGKIVFLTAPFNIPLWFMRDLIVGVLCSPLIFYCVKYLKLYWIIILGILHYLNVDSIIPGFSFNMFFYFSLGAYFSIHSKNFVKEFGRIQVLMFIINIFLLIITFITYESNLTNYILPLYTFTGVITIVNIVSNLLNRGFIRVNVFLSEASFFVYAIHLVLVLKITGKIYDTVFSNDSDINTMIRYFTIPLICIVICLCLYAILRKLFPKTLGVLMGSRLKIRF